MDNAEKRERCEALLRALSDAENAREVEMWVTYVLEGLDNMYGEEIIERISANLFQRLERGGW